MANDQEDEAAAQALPTYRVSQLHSRIAGNRPVSDFEGLVTHHPIANRGATIRDGVVMGAENPRGRSYGVIGGEVQELETLRTDRHRSLGEHQVLLIKDFILEDSRIPVGGRGVRAVDVPSPVAGYIGDVNAAEGRVDIYDREGGELIARVLHMNPITVQPRTTIAYGQALGTQSDRGLPDSAGIHVHMEVDTRYYNQYENYMADLISGRLSIDEGRRTQGIEALPVNDDGVIRIGESGDRVRDVQRVLDEAGYRDVRGQRLNGDGVYTLGMQAAVLNFQRDRGIPQSGDLDAATLELAPPPPRREFDRPDHMGPPGAPRIPLGQGASVGGDHPLLQQSRDAVQRLNSSLGLAGGPAADCMSASLACLARQSGLDRIDHVVLSRASATSPAGENVFVVQGSLNDPAHVIAHMRTDLAARTPVTESLQRLDQLQRDASQGTQPQAQELAQETQRRSGMSV